MTNQTQQPPPLCGPEWSARSLTELVAHLTERYRRSTHERLEAIHDALITPKRWSSERSEAAYCDFVDLFRCLADHVQSHLLLEDCALLPIVIAVEHPDVLAVRHSGDDVLNLVLRVADDHQQIRYLLDGLERSIQPNLSWTLLQPERHVPVADLQALALLLREQFDLEDRCLWPRAQQLFRQLR
jgi:iron-sulfur cluster repair protein YtfE (RIC family)